MEPKLEIEAGASIRRYALLDADTQWDTDCDADTAMHCERQGRGGYAEDRNNGA